MYCLYNLYNYVCIVCMSVCINKYIYNQQNTLNQIYVRTVRLYFFILYIQGYAINRKVIKKIMKKCPGDSINIC